MCKRNPFLLKRHVADIKYLSLQKMCTEHVLDIKKYQNVSGALSYLLPLYETQVLYELIIFNEQLIFRKRKKIKNIQDKLNFILGIQILYNPSK